MSKISNGEAKRRGRRGQSGPTIRGGSPEARRLAAVILEVLAGQRTPADAGAQVGVSLPRYYQLECRALEGLLAACEPRSRGPGRSPEREIAKLRAEVERLERQSARTQALLRLSQRAIGVSAPAAKKKDRSKGKRVRKPVARALKAAAKLAADPSPLPREAEDEKPR